jgi:hypothetical protein
MSRAAQKTRANLESMVNPDAIKLGRVNYLYYQGKNDPGAGRLACAFDMYGGSLTSVNDRKRFLIQTRA